MLDRLDLHKYNKHKFKLGLAQGFQIYTLFSFSVIKYPKF